MKKSLLFLAFFITVSLSYAQTKSITGETPDQKAKRIAWWTDARFGMFIHWGLYAMPARHEWIKTRERISDESYQRYFKHFDPDHFNPKEWAKKAKAAGMKYVVITTKHHEGFCLFDSKYTDYKATNTPAKRDLIKEFVDAFRAEDIKIGFYYSLIDWHHPHFTIDENHPQRFPGDAAKSPKEAAEYYEKINIGRDMNIYRAYIKNQLTELLSNYGKIDIIWPDYSYPGQYGKGSSDWDAIGIIKLIKKLQPQAIIDDRLDLRQYTDGGDFDTPEQVSVAKLAKYKGKYWETCQTFSGSWGYFRDQDEHPWKTERELLNILITSVANGGNTILNVGPTARGEFDHRANTSLDHLAYWMHANERSIYGCTYAPEEFKLPDLSDNKLTYNAKTKRLYLHLFTYPADGKLILPGNYTNKVTYVQMLNDASEVQFKSDKNDFILSLPKQKPPYEVPVIEMFLQ